MNGIRASWTAAALLAAVLPAHAEAIYSCVDARGRHLTSDRPIPECLDREQKELNPSGTLKRTVPPSLTAQERAEAEAQAQRMQDEQARAAEERRRDRALLTRYPDKAAHDKERSAALAMADEVMAAAKKRLALLQDERKKLDDETEFYKKDPARMPGRLKRQIDENHQQVAEQQRFIAGQDGERKRINTRFDEELVKLRELWTAGPAPAPGASASASR